MNDFSRNLPAEIWKVAETEINFTDKFVENYFSNRL